MHELVDIIQNNIWKYENPTIHSHITFYQNIICGYQSPNESTYQFTPDALIIYTQDQQISSIFQYSDFNEQKWQGKCLLSPTHSKCFLSINRHDPISIPWNKQFLKIAKINKFYFQHFGQVNKVYDKNSIITAFPNANVEPGATLAKGLLTSIGRFSYISGSNTSNLQIGRYSSIAMGVKTFGNAHPTSWLTSNPVFYTQHHQQLYKEATGIDFATHLYFEESPHANPVKIGHDVWIGEDSLLKPGITIGDGAIIAARSVVTKDIPPYAIVAGSPATVRKFRFDQKTINRLLHLQWWDYHPHELNLDWTNPIRAVEQLEGRLTSPAINKIHIPKRDYCLEFMRINQSIYAKNQSN